MPKPPLDLSSNWQSLTSRWDWFFLLTWAALLFFMPYSLGAVEAWSELVVVCLAALLAIGLVLRAWLEADFRLARSWTYLPLMAILALIVLQLIPLPAWLVGLVSGQTIQLREQFLGELAPGREGFATLSLYSHETAHDLRLALVFVAVFVATASAFRSKLQIKRALWMMFALGCVEASIALLQILTLSKKIHWIFAERTGVVTSGSFINYSHFCQFINLTVGAGLALLLVRMKQDSRRNRGKASRLADLRGERYLRPLTGIVLCVVAVFTSMSRNGVLSLLVASGVIAALLYRRGVLSVRGWLLGAVPWCVVVVLFFTSFDAVYERFAKLEDHKSIEDRLQMTAGTLRAWQDFPIFGAGLGTHEYVFPLYDEATNARMAEHADNDWAQLLEEFGLFGACAVLAFILGIFGVGVRLMLRGRTSLSTAAFGLSLGLLAVAWHSLSDFGQHLPGVFVLTATASGLLVAIARYDERKSAGKNRAKQELKSDPTRHTTARFAMPARVAMPVSGLVVLSVCWWAVSGALAAHKAEAWAGLAQDIEQRLQADQWLGSDQQYVDLLTAAEYAVDLEPGNVKYAYLLNLYRWHSIGRTRDAETGEVVVDASVRPLVEQLVEELSRVRLICPIYGPPYSLEGELRFLVLGEAEGKELIRNAAALIPYHAATSFIAGRVAASEGQIDEAEALLKRSVDLDPQLFRRVAGVYLDELHEPELAKQLAGDNYEKMVLLASLLESAQPPRQEYAQVGEALRVQAVLRLRELVEKREASAAQIFRLATIDLAAGSPEVAIKLMRRALALDYGNGSWRLVLARTLLAAGETEQALREAKIVQRLNPQSVRATKMIEELSGRPK